MKDKTLITVGLAAAVAAGPHAAISQSTDDALDPVRVAGDTHRVALENQFVRVLDVRLPPGKVEPRHRHPHGLSVYFSDWDARVTVDGRQPEVRHRKAGTFAWSDAVIHTVENVGTTGGHILRIELKPVPTTAAAQAPAPLEADLEAMLTAIERNAWEDFVARGDAAFRSGMTRQMLEAVSRQLAPRLKAGYHAGFLGQLDQQGFTVHLWKLAFDDRKDDHLVKMAVKDGKVGGFWVQ